MYENKVQGVRLTAGRLAQCFVAGNTLSASSAALSVIRRAPHEGRKPRRLQLKATSFSARQAYSARARSRARGDRASGTPRILLVGQIVTRSRDVD
jgi:hypothetical protein